MSFSVGSGGVRDKEIHQAPMAKKVERRPVSLSFKEKLLSPGGLGFLVSHDEEDDIVSGWRGFFAKKNAEMESADGVKESHADVDECNVPPSQCPVLSITQEQYTSWCRPWMNSLIIKALGLSVPKHVLFDRVRQMWKPQQPLKVVPLSNGYYIVSFSNKEDMDYAFSEGPWMIDDHYLLVQRWRPNFDPWRADCQKKIVVWTPLLPAFKVFGEERQLVYEGLHLVCFGCGMYGHEKMVCLDRERWDGVLEKVASSNANDGQENQSLADDGNISTKQSTVVVGDSEEVKHGPGEDVITGRKSNVGKDERYSVDVSKRAVIGKTEHARCTDKRTEVEVKKGGSTRANLETPTSLFGGEVRSATSGRHDFLGPQMLLRCEFRRGPNDLEDMGGVNGGSGVRKGLMQDLQGVMAQESRETIGGARAGFLNGNKPHLMGGDLKKSNSILGPSEKPKPEWVVVGSKRKKEEKLKFFGKENKPNDRPKSKLIKEVAKGAHFVEITNQFSSLPTDDMKDGASSEVLHPVESIGVPPVTKVLVSKDWNGCNNSLGIR
ncbi:hypothetical protein K1719_010562 [Acacia pycnantha]|nr:hypothetical protein K1719_010562 [Acacia pycnantha]